MTRALTENLDPELPVVEAILAGDHAAFEEFVRRHGKWVRGVIYGVLGNRDRLEDVSQHVWTTVWQQARTLKDVRRWRSWLYRLARNAAMDAGRDITRRRRHRQALREAAPIRSGPPEPGASSLNDEQREALLQALRGLPALYREPFVLRHLEQWSYQEIGEVLGLPVDTVETRLVRARRQLREALRDRI